MQLVLSYLKSYWRESGIALLVIALIGTCWMFYQSNKAHEVEVTTMTKENAENVKALQDELSISRQNAIAVSESVEKIQQGYSIPQVVYHVERVQNEPITTTVEKQIQSKDESLPAEAVAKTDKTVVVEQDSATVNVYKINTYRNWEIGIGAGIHDNDKYIPLSIQRNYSRNQSIEIEGHYSLDHNKLNGGAIKWKKHF